MTNREEEGLLAPAGSKNSETNTHKVKQSHGSNKIDELKALIKLGKACLFSFSTLVNAMVKLYERTRYKAIYFCLHK